MHGNKWTTDYHDLFGTDCDVVCHPNCVSSIPNTCGLPAELAEHMVGQGEEPLSKRPRSDEGTEKENSGEEEICLDIGATKRTTSIVVRKEKMTMFRFVCVVIHHLL